MIDRGIIKWQPFNSCFNQENILKDIKQNKMRKSFPTLSEDQLEIIEQRLIEAYTLKVIVNIAYYYDGYIKNITGKINYFNSQTKKISLNNQTIYFKQILKITFFN